MTPHIEPNARILKPAPVAATAKPVAARRETAVQRADREAREHEEAVEHLAQDIENIMAREGSVKEEDLLTLGWSLPTINELQDEALALVRHRAIARVI